MAKSGIGWMLLPIGLIVAFIGLFMASPWITAVMTIIGVLITVLNIDKAESQKMILLGILFGVSGGLSLSFGGVEALSSFVSYANNFLAYIGTMLSAATVTLVVKILYEKGKS